ncbi:MAG: hypothetical protein LUE20_07105 [Oscillospiraceae bacterium]|nr:hypothetical protein [Oscillospiraceae bacterium]
MKMRKLMAVVLAVVVAISAMAISAFATEYEEISIELTNASTSSSASATVSWTVPAYAIFGYLNNGDSLTVTLPNNLAAYGSFARYPISYSLTVNGVTVSLEGVTVPEDCTSNTYTTPSNSPDEIYVDAAGTGIVTYADIAAAVEAGGEVSDVAMVDDDGNLYWLGYNYGTYTQTVEVGYFARNYGTVGAAMIPQSTLVSENTPVTITATISGVDEDDLLPVSSYCDASTGYSWAPGAFDTYTSSNSLVTAVVATVNPTTPNTTDTTAWNYYLLVENTVVTATSSYSYNVGPSYGSSEFITYTPVDGSAASTIKFADVTAFGSISKSDSTSTSTDTVTIISDTTSDGATGEALYWDHTLANRAIVATAAATEGAYAEVVIDLSTYGTGYIKGLAVYTLYANATVDAAENSSSALWYGSSLYNTTVSTYLLNGTTTELRFEVPVSYLYDTTYGVYNGSFYVYQLVSTGTSTSSSNVYTNRYSWDSGAALKVSSDGGATLVIYMPVDDTTVDVEDPVESTDTETEEDDMSVVDDDEPAEEEAAETNPTTGIVLALVPMAVAAAAAVASKRR